MSNIDFNEWCAAEKRHRNLRRKFALSLCQSYNGIVYDKDDGFKSLDASVGMIWDIADRLAKAEPKENT